MNVLDKARQAYGAPTAAIRTGRGAEYEAFARVTRQLRAAAGDPARSFPALAAALHENRRLWTCLASDLLNPTNGLPEELRARLLYLAEFSRLQSSRVLAGAASADVLVEVNTAVMQGLRGGSAAA